MISPHLTLWLNTLSAKRIIVGFSGGRDSTVLLHALKGLMSGRGLALEAWHVNHQLQAEASDWVRHCELFCHEHQIPFKAFPVVLEQASGLSLEAEARQARYGVFAAHLEPGDVLVTAHHQQDNAETFLHHAFRGAGVRGLRGIAPAQALSLGLLVRPLLEASAEEIAAYAESHRLEWITDPSNKNVRFSRNFIRQELLPLVKTHYSGAVSCLARTIRHAAEAEELLDILAEQDFQKSFVKMPYGESLNLELFLNFTLAQQKNTLRYWLKMIKIMPPEEAPLVEFLRQLKEASRERHPRLELGEWFFSVYQRHLYLIPLHTIPPFGKGGLGGISAPNNLAGKKRKKYFQEHQVPPWFRKRSNECCCHLAQKYTRGVVPAKGCDSITRGGIQQK